MCKIQHSCNNNIIISMTKQKESARLVKNEGSIFLYCLCNFVSFRLANHEVKEEEQVTREDPDMMRPVM